KVPVFDPSSPCEAKEMVFKAFEISEKYEIPVILRPAIRICHARQWIPFSDPIILDRKAAFSKDPGRWAATPKFRLALHHKLNDTLKRIALEEGDLDGLNRLEGPAPGGPLGIVAGGPSLAHLRDLLSDFNLAFPLLSIGLPHPMNPNILEDFLKAHDRVLVLEEPEDAIERCFKDRNRVMGRLSGHVPNAGELTPETMADVLRNVFAELELKSESAALEISTDPLEEPLKEAARPPQRPTLCPGCPHRNAFFAIRKALPKAIYTSDIGCYTLGINLRAVDTCLNMGAAISMACGFDQAYRQSRQDRPVVATIGDSTFLHSGLTGLLNAVYTRARFVLVILDNQVTAMTGMQPAISTGRLADGSQGVAVTLEGAVKGCGVKWLKVMEPYDFEALKTAIEEAHAYTRTADGGVAVLITRAPCLVHERSARDRWKDVQMGLDQEKCQGCGTCVHSFECPALIQDEKNAKVRIDRTICVDCGSCRWACKEGALDFRQNSGS
ncbi:MAG: indolepyruvate oxidoreductase, partial [Planctomycetes bacterium]|nr:indolepyruvate oxidoreductase [Planctomycetota bacterium]